MSTRRGKSGSTTRTLIEAGPALAGIGTMLAGIAAVAALFLSQSSGSGPGSTDPPASIGTPVPTTAATVLPTDVPATPVVFESLGDVIVRLDRAADDASVPGQSTDRGGYLEVGPMAGLGMAAPDAWPEPEIGAWTDVPPGASPGSDPELLGSIVIASPDEAAIFEDPDGTYDISMLLLSASKRLASEAQQGDVLGTRRVELSLDCRLLHDGHLRLPEAAGPYLIYERCGGEPMLLFNAELRDPDATYVVSVYARIADRADIPALKRLFESMIVEPRGLPA